MTDSAGGREAEIERPCRYCGKDATHGTAGICPDCLTPEALRDRMADLPEPLRSTMLRVGRDIGIVAPVEADAKDGA